MRNFGEAFDRLVSRRSTCAGELESLIDELLAPRGFWGHTVARRDH